VAEDIRLDGAGYRAEKSVDFLLDLRLGEEREMSCGGGQWAAQLVAGTPLCRWEGPVSEGGGGDKPGSK
jgi:hypothetical protein